MSFATDAIRAACTARTLYESPLGPMLLARTRRGLAGAWFLNQKDHPGELPGPDRPEDPLLAQTVRQFERYFAGSTEGFDVPLDLLGTPFQRAVWQALLAIPAGTTSTYGAIARTVGTPQAVRAVGSAIGKNPIGVIVPCHRVVGSNGALTGYAGGIERKAALLVLEGSRPSGVPMPAQRPLFERAA